MVNDMLSTNEFALSYADDTVILAESINQNDAQFILTQRFQNLSNWYQTNSLSLNVGKTKCNGFFK